MRQARLACETADFIRRQFGPIDVVYVLGSGLGDFADTIHQPEVVNYSEIPNVPVSGVQGHAGKLVVGERNDKRFAIMQGRVHLYEDYSPDTVTRLLRALVANGAQFVLITNAGGAISFEIADFVCITNQINFQRENLSQYLARNCNASGQLILPPSPYSRQARQMLLDTGVEIGCTLQEGVYAGLLGSSYETPAEIQMLKTLGADAVGMSTIMEAYAAYRMGAKVAGLSIMTNLAAGISKVPLDHMDVMQTGERIKGSLINLLDHASPKFAEAA